MPALAVFMIYCCNAAKDRLGIGCIRERIMEGLQAARAKGRIGGRHPALSGDQKIVVLRLKSEGRAIKRIAGLFKVSAATVKRV